MMKRKPEAACVIGRDVRCIFNPHCQMIQVLPAPEWDCAVGREEVHTRLPGEGGRVEHLILILGLGGPGLGVGPRVIDP